MSDTGGFKTTSQKYAPWLWGLLALFCARVIAQPLSLVVSNSIIPAFDHWYSGVLPYWLILLSQLMIVLILFSVARNFSNATVTANPITGKLLLIVGALYLMSMLARLVLGMSLYKDHEWFDNPIPTFFHMVLAAFVLSVGHYHWRYGRRSA